MCYKSISIFNPLRRPMSMASLMAAALTLFAPGAFAWSCTTCDQFGTCDDGASWLVTQDVWGPATNWQQCLYSDSHSYWQVVANLKAQAWVASYPHASYNVNEALNDVLSNSTPLLAAWNASYPETNKFDFAYDLWLNGTTYEVMIWLNWNNTAPIGGSPFTNATIDGVTYNVYEGAGGSGPYCISFLPQNDMMDTATNFNLCDVLSWINNLQWSGGPGGYFWQNPNFDSIQLGWEICDTYGATVAYTMNYFNVYNGNASTAPPTPTVEKSLWQANFDNTFPNDGDYGFSDRDGSPAATGGWAINPTGGIGGSASFEYTVNFSAWSNSPPASYSGFGIGADESPLPYPLTSSSQSSYRLYLSAKAGGTSAGVTNVPGQVDLSFFIPNGTEVYDLTSTFMLSTNWQSFEFDGGTNLEVATWLTGAQSLFNQDVSQVNKMEVQISVPGSPNIATLFGYDTNNTVDIDNIKVDELVPGLAPLTIIHTNTNAMVVWANPATGGAAQLQSATNVTGPYLNVAGATSATASPYAVPSGTNQQFFRNVWVP
jgi:hypothetical protein